MQLRWELMMAAFVGVSVLTICQKWFLNRVIGHVDQLEIMVRATEGWPKLIRQDMASTVVLLQMANGLLAAILAVLLIR